MSAAGTRGLPAALQPWQAWLGWFDAELAEALGDVVRRLAQLAGPAHAVTGRQQTEPDGLGDLRQQGRYERLLMSEWLLAEEWPLEFLRRAASSEHLFLAPSLRSTPSDRHVVAIFDAGPLQWGAPRVAHLAVLILLARRAEQLGGTLRWGLLQLPGQLHAMEGVSSLRKLLNGRALTAGDATAVSLWREALDSDALAGAGAGSDARERAECWWIGGPPGLEAEAPGSHERRLELRHAWSGTMLHATLQLPKSQRVCDLPLPAELQLGALLRGQFAKAGAANKPSPGTARTERRLSLTRRPLISVDGRHVATFLLGASAVLVVSPRRRPGAQGRKVTVTEQAWARGRSLVAARLHGNKEVQGLVMDEQHLNFWQIYQWNPMPRPLSEDVAMAIDTAAAMPLIVLDNGRNKTSCVMVVDERRRLMAWQRPRDIKLDGRRSASTGPVCVAEQVMATVHGAPHSFFHASLKDNTLWLAHLAWTNGALRPQAPAVPLLAVKPLASGVTPVFLCVQQGPSGIVAVAYAAHVRQVGGVQSWKVECHFGANGLLGSPDGTGRGRMEVDIPSHQRVVGLVRTGHDDDRQALLLVLSADRKTLNLVSAHHYKPVFTTPGSIAQAVVCPRTGRVAIITDDRALHFIEGGSGELIMQMTQEEHRPAPVTETAEVQA